MADEINGSIENEEATEELETPAGGEGATSGEAGAESGGEDAFDEEATAAALETLKTANPALYNQLMAQMEAEDEEDDDEPGEGDDDEPGEGESKPKDAEPQDDGEDDETLIADSNLSFQRTRSNIVSQAQREDAAYREAFNQHKAAQSRTTKMIDRLTKAGMDEEEAEQDEVIREMRQDEKRAYDKAVQVYQRAQAARATLSKLDAIRDELSFLPKSIQRHGYDYAYLRAVDPKKAPEYAINDTLSIAERSKRLKAYLVSQGKVKAHGAKSAEADRIKKVLGKLKGKVKGQRKGGSRGGASRASQQRSPNMDPAARAALNKSWS